MDDVIVADAAQQRCDIEQRHNERPKAFYTLGECQNAGWLRVDRKEVDGKTVGSHAAEKLVGHHGLTAHDSQRWCDHQHAKLRRRRMRRLRFAHTASLSLRVLVVSLGAFVASAFASDELRVKREGAVTRYSDPNVSVMGHAQSGEVTSYSPDGRWLGLLVGERWHLVDRPANTLVEAHAMNLRGSSNNVLQWTPDNRLMRVRGSDLEFWDPDRGEVETTVPLPEIDVGRSPEEIEWQLWRSGDASGERWLHVVFLSKARSQGEPEREAYKLTRFWIGVVDALERRVVQTLAFDRMVHRGAATSQRWHHLFAAGDFFLVNLSSMGPARNPDFRFRRSGSGWKQLSGHGSERTTAAPRTLDWSHVTFDETRVAFGSDNEVHVADFESGESLALTVHPRSENGGFGHGYLHGDRVVYSLFDWVVGRDQSIYVWDWRTDETPMRVATIRPPPGPSFFARARPFMAPDGRQVAWHEQRADERVEVVTLDLDRAEALKETGR